jgi:AcrR family transcriptional regulator
MRILNQPPPRGRGRPRDPETDIAILEAVADALAEDGFARLSIEDVAVRAGVVKTTIYRRWGSKFELIEALLDSINEALPIEESGDIRSDLIAFFRVLLNGRAAVGKRIAILSAMIAESVHNPQIAELLRRRYMQPRRAKMIGIVHNAKRRGALRPDLDEAGLVDQLAGLIWYRRLVVGIPIRRDEAERLVDQLLEGAR